MSLVLDQLWRETLGDSRVTVAILDGPVDRTHPSLANARLVQLPTLLDVKRGQGSQHGNFVASLIFGQHDGPVRGVAPGCRGLVLPIFSSDTNDDLRPCSQLDLARAITQALTGGAQVINISGGEFTPGDQAHPLLADVVRECARRGIVIVAAAGNNGCDCLHLPAAMGSVLAVGAMDDRGQPLPTSNWGGAYQRQGIVAPGQDLLGAGTDRQTIRLTGTSGAAAIVSGVVALLLSLQIRRGYRPDPQGVRRALLESAVDCRAQLAWDCPRLLVGRLNVSGAIALLFKEPAPMTPSDVNSPTDANATPATEITAFATPTFSYPGINPSAIQPSACGCPTGAKQLVYALGQLEVDFINDARRDSMAQRMARGIYAEKYKEYEDGGKKSDPPKLSVNPKSPFDYQSLNKHFEQNPTDAAFVEWTLWLDGTPIYAIRPEGAFAAETYKQLRDFLIDHTNGVERISVPGVISGNARLSSGQVVLVVVPDLGGMYSWSTKELVKSAMVPLSIGADDNAKKEYDKKSAGIKHFLEKIYHGLRNLGILPQDRALNFGATNCFNFAEIYETAIQANMELDSINVVRSPLCRPGSDCWDIELYFFKPEAIIQTMRQVHRFTVDVSDVVPVTIGQIRSWHTR